MQDRPRRPRRMVSPSGLVVLRALGYRYSYNREAWVHRVGGGRFGPVFTEVASFGVSEMPAELIGRLEEQLNEPQTIRVLPPEDREALPQRATRRRGDRLIPVRWLHDEEHRVVYVDGRPPLVGGTDRAKQPKPAARPKVVPIKSSRATG
jgi:hypothetical protein